MEGFRFGLNTKTTAKNNFETHGRPSNPLQAFESFDAGQYLRYSLEAMQLSTQQVSALTALRELFGERVTTSAAAREAHGRSESYHASHLPDLVVFPESTAEVVD